MIDLRDTQGYAFSSNKNDDPERFVLHLKNATGIMDGLNGNSVSMYIEHNELSVLIEHPRTRKVRYHQCHGTGDLQ